MDILFFFLKNDMFVHKLRRGPFNVHVGMCECCGLYRCTVVNLLNAKGMNFVICFEYVSAFSHRKHTNTEVQLKKKNEYLTVVLTSFPHTQNSYPSHHHTNIHI